MSHLGEVDYLADLELRVVRDQDELDTDFGREVLEQGGDPVPVPLRDEPEGLVQDQHLPHRGAPQDQVGHAEGKRSDINHTSSGLGGGVVGLPVPYKFQNGLGAASLSLKGYAKRVWSIEYGQAPSDEGPDPGMDGLLNLRGYFLDDRPGFRRRFEGLGFGGDAEPFAGPGFDPESELTQTGGCLLAESGKFVHSSNSLK
jgi:hypothetical protein